jgi:DeoR family fructose operon transcriptional repressor
MRAHERIIALKQKIEAEGSASVSDLARDWAVSEMTIRRDLQRLAAVGVVARVHGGAVAGERLRFRQRHEEHLAEKRQAVAKLAALIPATGCIYLDGSTTIFQLVAALAGRPGLVVATNNIDTFQRIAAVSGIDAILIAGHLHRETDNFIGPLARRCIAGLNFDAAFFSSFGLDPGLGPCEPVLDDAEIKQCVAERSRRHCLALNHHKLGRPAAGAWSLPCDAAHLATDLDPADERLAPYRHRFAAIL